MSPLWSVPPSRPTGRIRKLLVANRGEIAIRILQAARELNLETVTLHTSSDTTHTFHAHFSHLLSSVSGYLDSALILSLALQSGCDTIHPGYGFLSESSSFAQACADAGIRFVGPDPRVLEVTGSKTLARGLAVECGVPVLQGLHEATDDLEVARRFAERLGWPVVVKAVDGGGGRGIRFVNAAGEFVDAFRRACGESPAGKVFVERAAAAGARHVEVQVVGDLHGNVQPVGTRECSVQRRFQKVVEFAPSLVHAEVLRDLANDSVRMAQTMNYSSLATFEWLVDPTTTPPAAYFLEINPRLQVEHTVTEAVHGVDLVKLQLQIAQGHPLTSTLLPPPRGHAIQLRITAEDPSKNFSLSLGRISRFVLPTGNGVRVDTHLRSGTPVIIGPDFDSLLCKIIVHGETWESTVSKARRALEDSVIDGVATNIPLLRGILASDDFRAADVGIRWLETNIHNLLLPPRQSSSLFAPPSTSPHFPTTSAAVGAPMLRKDDAWAVHLSPNTAPEHIQKHHVTISRLLQNDFPNSLAAEVTYTTAASVSTYKLLLNKTVLGAAVGSHRKGEAARQDHVTVPFGGEVVEVNVQHGDDVHTGEVLCVVRQMKTELEVRAGVAGRVIWVWEVKVGAIVEGGELVCELDIGIGQAEAKL
ncbi:carboxylase:pyruvate/acetyl-coa/propionyl-CoA [Tricharina praecox]|uniref:carboxylase:pyruvate/acetyl-coa/propionyl-CoA n=1 Tax=Tricharina praecox TaxID=43433 RepID=UPI00221EF28E|nr:carboxylase:pyruvate/acetyl-coa/propionyl-CoA [Tricharina praecox]KAI5854129.1 carboxylase:pyruvate/acetyl-coa/propionyl-CoA [Tricharina praecox]